MRINHSIPLMYVEDRYRQLKAYLKHPDTDLRYVLSVVGLFCIVVWYLIIGDWRTAVSILAAVGSITLSYSTFYCWGALIVTVIRKKQFEWKLARNASITTAVMITLIVVFDVPLDLAGGIIAFTAVWAAVVIAIRLFVHK